MENKNYKILVSSPLIDEPELLAFSETDGYLYFTDKANEKTVKRVKPSNGEWVQENMNMLHGAATAGYGVVYKWVDCV